MISWKELKSKDLQDRIARAMDFFEPVMNYIIAYYDGTIENEFDYIINCYDKYINLYDNGKLFGTACTDNFENPGDLLSWLAKTLAEHYKDQEEEDE